MITLIQPWYNSTNANRQTELFECLKNNLSNPLIDKVILFAEHQPPITNDKLKVVFIGRRATFAEMFACPIQGVKVVANTDIHFDGTLSQALDIKDNECYALSRWDKVKGTLKPYHAPDSQDVWIFANSPKGIGNYSPGMPGCDNRIAREILDAGYKITNPCLSINAIHLHESGYRTYSYKDTVHGEYHYLHASRL